MADDLETVVRRADPDRWASSRFIGDPVRRGDVIALYAFEHELARAERVTSNTLMAEIRLVWWREALEEIDGGRPARAHPVVAALAAAVDRHDLPTAPLEAMIEGRIRALETPSLGLGEALAWARAAAASAVTAARILGGEEGSADAAPAGRLWALAHLAWSGRVDAAEAAAQIEADWPEARRSARRLSMTVFPAVAHATLARRGRPPREEDAGWRRLKVLRAVMTGRL